MNCEKRKKRIGIYGLLFVMLMAALYLYEPFSLAQENNTITKTDINTSEITTTEKTPTTAVQNQQTQETTTAQQEDGEQTASTATESATTEESSAYREEKNTQKRSNAVYKVEYYHETMPGSEKYNLEERETKTGAAGETVEAQVKPYTGYTLDQENEQNIENGTVAADGSLVLKLYYKITVNPTVRYTVTDFNLYKGTKNHQIQLSDKVPIGKGEYFFTEIMLTTKVEDGTFSSLDSVHITPFLNGHELWLGNTWLQTDDYNVTDESGVAVGRFYVNETGDLVIDFDDSVQSRKKMTLHLMIPNQICNNDNANERVDNITIGSVAKPFLFQWTYEYQVERYQQNLDGSFSLADRESYTGEAGSDVTAMPKEYAGFSEDISNKNRDVSQVLPENNNTVLRLFYKRNIYGYKVEYYQQTADEQGYELKESTTATGLYGAQVLAPKKQYVGFHENTLYGDRVPSGLIADDNSLVLRLYYDRNTNISYKVEHYQQKLDSSGYQLAQTEELTGVMGAQVSADVKSYEGFVENSVHPDRIATGVVEADGSLVLRLYYDRKHDTQYKVEYYKKVAGGNTYLLVERMTKAGTTGGEVSVQGKIYPGFRENLTAAGRKAEGTVLGNGGLVLKLFYDQEETQVTIRKHWAGDGTGTVTKRPSQVNAELYADGTSTGKTVTLSGTGNDWYQTVGHLPKYNNDGNAIQYSVKETTKVSGYTVSYGYVNGQLVITNTYAGRGIFRQGGYAPYVISKISGNAPKTKAAFQFALNAKTVDAPMPDHTGGTAKTITIAGEGTQNFGVIDFNREGTFVYEVQEVDSKQKDYVCDSSLYVMTVETAKTPAGTYEGLVTLEKNAQYASAMVFTNAYGASSSKVSAKAKSAGGTSAKTNQASDSGNQVTVNNNNQAVSGSVDTDTTATSADAATTATNAIGVSSTAATTGDYIQISILLLLMLIAAAAILISLKQQNMKY